ncbi:MAG: hypothetical protein BWK80_10870 [Desulfobacteraceae bacterium IS3]|nr:MAG: hypothetical protein BWK80_10870 [Desulfobacteraceae bacterium IS3]
MISLRYLEIFEFILFVKLNPVLFAPFAIFAREKKGLCPFVAEKHPEIFSTNGHELLHELKYTNFF